MVFVLPHCFARKHYFDIAQEHSQINGDNKNKNKNKTISMTILLLLLLYTIIIIISRNNEWNYHSWK